MTVGGDVTHYYVCNGCGQACGVQTPKPSWQHAWSAKREELFYIYGTSKVELDAIESLMDQAWVDGREKGEQAKKRNCGLGMLDQSRVNLTELRRIQAQLPVAGNSRSLIYMLIDELEKELFSLKSSLK